MRIEIANQCDAAGEPVVNTLVAALLELGFDARRTGEAISGDPSLVTLKLCATSWEKPQSGRIPIEGENTIIERAFRALPVAFESLPVLTEGESKEIRLWTEKVVIQRFKPTVYSYTANRYGEVPGTEVIRTRFTSEVFRRMARLSDVDAKRPQSAFLAEIEGSGGPLVVQRKVQTCNLETRIKRYHIGSPVHRYLFTGEYPSTQACGPLRRWARLDQPVVCFDWRHPLQGPDGRRLADEPLPDDYAALWMEDLSSAKEMARKTFLWLEEMFAERELLLVDMCVFIDRHGQLIYGEISPDCMRVRFGLGNPQAAKSADKDLWRTGRSPDALRQRYHKLFDVLFANKPKKNKEASWPHTR